MKKIIYSTSRIGPGIQYYPYAVFLTFGDYSGADLLDPLKYALIFDPLAIDIKIYTTSAIFCQKKEPFDMD